MRRGILLYLGFVVVFLLVFFRVGFLGFSVLWLGCFLFFLLVLVRLSIRGLVSSVVVLVLFL